VGLSAPSDIVTILVAQVPDKPNAPTVARVLDLIQVNWVAPHDGYTDITSYKIEFRHTDENKFSTDVSCDAANPTILAAL
jgi:hypothetical protein